MENLSVWRNSGTVTAPNVQLWFTIHIFSKQPFYGNYSTLDSHKYKHCNFSRCCLYSSRSVCEPASQQGSHCVTAKASKSKTSHTHKKISKKHFSCIYSSDKTLFFSQIADCLALKLAFKGIIRAPFSRSLFIFVFLVGK